MVIISTSDNCIYKASAGGWGGEGEVSLAFLFFLTSQKQESSFQQVDGLVTRNVSVFYLQQVPLYFKAMSNSIRFLLRSFLAFFSCLYCTSMLQVKCQEINQLIPKCQMEFFDKICKKTSPSILHIQNSLGIKFQLKLRILNFWAKLT